MINRDRYRQLFLHFSPEDETLTRDADWIFKDFDGYDAKVEAIQSLLHLAAYYSEQLATQHAVDSHARKDLRGAIEDKVVCFRMFDIQVKILTIIEDDFETLENEREIMGQATERFNNEQN